MGVSTEGDPKASYSVVGNEREADEEMLEKQGTRGDRLPESERGRGDAKGKTRGGKCVPKTSKILAFQIKSEGLRDQIQYM